MEKSGCSRTDYTRLREIFELRKGDLLEDMEIEDEEPALPIKLDTLKRRLRQQLPLLKLMRKAITVNMEKQPSMPSRDKNLGHIIRDVWIYWYDPLDLVRNILSARFLVTKMHFGMAEYSDNPTELWNSRAWGSSIRAASGDNAYTREEELIIPGDIVRFEQAPGEVFTKGRVLFVGRDCRSTVVEVGRPIVVTLQAVVLLRDLASNAYSTQIHTLLPSDLDDHELVILEDKLLEVPPSSILHHLSIYLDREHDEDEDEIIIPDDRFFVRRVINLSTVTIRALKLLQATRGELEVAYYGREFLVERFARNRVVSLPFQLFIDDFGVHRNMYRALKAFYWIPANLAYEERRKIANVFTLSLGPHGAAIGDVVEAFAESIRELDRGCLLNINGEDWMVCAFTLAFLGDIPQQADNAGFLRHTANLGCRSCWCPKKKKSKLDYDIVGFGRYHIPISRLREESNDYEGARLRRFEQETGMKKQEAAVVVLAPSLDLIQARPYDAPHSEWRGLGRVLQGLLFSTILTKRGCSSYLRHFQKFRYPQHWPRMQSPAFYIWSWSLSEAGRATILCPLILRSHANGLWFRLKYLYAADRRLNATNRFARPMEAVIWAFSVIASCNSTIGSQKYIHPDEIHRRVVSARRCYQLLLLTAADAATGGGDLTARDAIPRSDDLDGPEGTERPDTSLGLDATVGPETLLDEAANEVEETDMFESTSTSASESESESYDNAVIDGSRKDPEEEALPRRGLTKWQKLLGLPNVHAGLHLAETAREFSTVMNSNVLAGELKHK